MAAEERSHLSLVLLGNQRTRSVDHTAAYANQGRRLIKYRCLFWQKFGKVGLRQP